MVTHTRFIDYDSVLDSAFKAMRETNALRFKGTVDHLYSLYGKDLESRRGEVFHVTDTDEEYVCDGTTWNQISRSPDISTPEVTRYNTKIISYCPHCGGAVTHITPKGRSEGHQQCEWCMSIINIYED